MQRRENNKLGPVRKVTGRETHHYVVCPADMRTVMQDEQGRVMVFLSRYKANEVINARKLGTMAIVGMGDEKWALFQREEPNHVVVGD